MIDPWVVLGLVGLAMWAMALLLTVLLVLVTELRERRRVQRGLKRIAAGVDDELSRRRDSTRLRLVVDQVGDDVDGAVFADVVPFPARNGHNPTGGAA